MSNLSADDKKYRSPPGLKWGKLYDRVLFETKHRAETGVGIRAGGKEKKTTPGH